jgi:hypothetical protein
MSKQSPKTPTVEYFYKYFSVGDVFKAKRDWQTFEFLGFNGPESDMKDYTNAIRVNKGDLIIVTKHIFFDKTEKIIVFHVNNHQYSTISYHSMICHKPGVYLSRVTK